MSATLAGLCLATGQVATGLTAQAGPAARVSIGSGFQVASLCLCLMYVDAWQRITRLQHSGANGSGLRFLLLLLPGLVAVVVTVAAGQHHFDALSLVREYASRQSRFSVALLQHLKLVGMAFVPTLLLGLTGGILAWRLPRFNAALFALLNFLQTIPSLALFALLMVPLAWLAHHSPLLQAMGFGGIGEAPSVVALILYTLLPLTRNTCTALTEVPADTCEAARAMGMSRRQVFVKITLPLSLPVILSGVRIAVVQMIGLAVLAGLIGGGGLGSFVWEGLGERAIDLVLLGALPTIALAVVADLVMQGVVWVVRPVRG